MVPPAALKMPLLAPPLVRASVPVAAVIAPVLLNATPKLLLPAPVALTRVPVLLKVALAPPLLFQPALLMVAAVIDFPALPAMARIAPLWMLSERPEPMVPPVKARLPVTVSVAPV